MKITFANGTQQDYLSAIETEEFYNGSSRRTLSFTLPSNTSIDEINTIASNEGNLQSLTLSNGEVTNIYDGYVLKLELGIKQVLSSAETNTYADSLILKLGKRTYLEQQIYSRMQ